MSQGGMVRKVPKMCHVLFKWPQSTFYSRDKNLVEMQKKRKKKHCIETTIKNKEKLKKIEKHKI